MSSESNSQHDFPRAIGNPATQAFIAAGYTRMEQLTLVSEAELLRLHGVGPKAIRILRELFAARGQSFAEPAAPGKRGKAS